LTGDIASGRAEDSRSFSQKNSQSEFFCEKDKKSTMLPQAILPFTGCNARFDELPRNSYDLLMSGLKINVHQAAPPNITCYVHLHNT
jgi:hypothetical protein